MQSENQPGPDLPAWLRPLQEWVERHRDTVVPAFVITVIIAVAVGVLAYRLSPTDIERAEADLRTSCAVVNAIEEEAPRQLKDCRGHRERAAELRKLVAENEGSSDFEWLEWQRAKAQGHIQLAAAAGDRRDHLLRLAAEYRRLVAEANCEILRAKDAAERGTPHAVAPRVRALLNPILTNH